MNDFTVSRRDIFKLIAAASAATALPAPNLAAQTLHSAPLAYKNPFLDPAYSNPVIPWEKPLVEPEIKTLEALCDIIIPGDADSPAPSAIKIPDFISEWIGAPYEPNQTDKEIIRGGIGWINTHSNSLHSAPFANLTAPQQIAIVDSICDWLNPAPELAIGANFFRKLRALTLGGYYSHSSTWKSLGYVGNVPIAGPYPGVPEEIIKMLGLEGV